MIADRRSQINKVCDRLRSYGNILLSHDSTLECSIVGTVYVMNVFIIAAAKILTTRTKTRPAIGTKSSRRFIYRSAEEAEAKFLQHENCIRSLSNPKPMFSTVLELATTRLIMTKRRSKFACSKISAPPRWQCCLLFSLHARVYLAFSMTKTYACGRLCDRCDYIETASFAIVCDCFRSAICDLRSSAIVCDHMETSLK